MENNEIPRKNRLELLTPAEKSIYDAIQKVEELPADKRLTNAIYLLEKAQNEVADFVDDIEVKHKYYYCPDCGFRFVLPHNASDTDMRIFQSFEIFHMNPKLNIPCRCNLSEINKDEFLKLFD